MNVLFADTITALQNAYDNLREAFITAGNESNPDEPAIQDAMNRTSEAMSHAQRLAAKYPMPEKAAPADTSFNDSNDSGVPVMGRSNKNARGNN